MSKLFRAALVASLVCAPGVRAQQVPPARADSAVPAAPALASFARPNGMLLRPDSAVYDISVRRDTTTTAMGIRTVRVSESVLAGQPAWLIVESRTGTVLPTSDSVYVARSDLAPVRWSAMNGQSELAVSFTRDTMFGGLSGYQGRASFTAPLPADALLSPAMTEQVVLLLPLQLGYRSAASLVQIAQGSVRSVPATLSVEHDDKPVIAGKEVDCWVVALRAGAVEERIWVSKEMPRVVRTEQATSGGMVSSVLRM